METVLRLAPLLTISVLILPVGAGVLGTLAPAFGWLPELGGERLTLDPFRKLLDWLGFWDALRLSLVTGVVSTIIALVLCIWLVAAWHDTRLFRFITRSLSPLLSVPHAAAAFGLAFMIAPSGWIFRAFSPWATGWERPPDLLIVQDPLGLTLILGLVVKELPFLLLMTLAALPQTDARMAVAAQTMGYGKTIAWIKTVLPQLYPQIRLPVLAVLAYGMSVVDMAVILGPTRPASLGVQVVNWISDPDLALRFVASAAASVLLGAILVTLFLWSVAEKLVALGGRKWCAQGARLQHPDMALRVSALGLTLSFIALVAFGMLGLLLWSFAGLWRFPDMLPGSYRITTWMREGAALSHTALDTALIAGFSVVISVTIVILCLEAETRLKLRMTPRSRLILFLPLLVPQVGFMPGLQTLALQLGMDGGVVPVMLTHVLFVLPYVFLSLSDPWRSLDPRYETAAFCLGADANHTLWRVRLPLLLRPVLIASAVGFAVSVGQYLPTLLIGGGRVETLTTEAVALSSGGNRRIIGVYAWSQMLLPFVAFALALLIPVFVYRKRRGMAVA